MSNIPELMKQGEIIMADIPVREFHETPEQNPVPNSLEGINGEDTLSYTTVKYPEDLPERLKMKTAMIKSLVDSLNTYKAWAVGYVIQPISMRLRGETFESRMESLDRFYETDFADFLALNDIMHRLQNQVHEEELEEQTGRPNPLVLQNRKAIIAKYSKDIDDISGNVVQEKSGKNVELILNAPEDWESADVKFQGMIHDLRNIITSIKGNIQLAQRAKDMKTFDEGVSYVDSFFPNLVSFVDAMEQCLLEKFPKDELDLLIIGSLVKDWGKEAKRVLDLDVDYETPLDFGNKKVVYSDVWLKLLLGNISQNAVKAYRAREGSNPADHQEKTITVIMQLSPDSKSCSFIFEDRGVGFLNSKILETGIFPQGESFWGKGNNFEGTAIGMPTHQAIIEKHYNGQLIPSNVLDEKGNIIGARITARFPLAE